MIHFERRYKQYYGWVSSCYKQCCTDHRKYRLISRTSASDLMDDSDYQCWKNIYVFNFILCFSPHTDKNIAIYPSVYFLHSVNTHIWTGLCPDQSILCQVLHNTHTETDVLFCFKGILSTNYWRIRYETLFFQFKKADHRYWKLINYALT